MVDREAESYGAVRNMCTEAQTKMMGFMLFAVETTTTPKTAYKYARNVLLVSRKQTGVDLEGSGFKDLKNLHERLRVEYPHPPKDRRPLMQQDYKQMWAVLRPQAFSTKLFKALILVMFQAVSRFGDLKDVKRSDIVREGDLVTIKIDKHKTSHHMTGQVFDTKFITVPKKVNRTNKNLSAALALNEYLKEDPLDSSVTPLKNQYLFRTKDGKQLVYRQQLKALRSVLTQIGKDPMCYGMHSPRIGGATCAMVSSGGNEFIVKQMGFWKGKSVQLYSRPTVELICEIQQGMMSTEVTRSTAQMAE